MKKELFGEVNGREVYLYTLENSHGMKVTVSSFGALIIRIWAPDHNGNFADVALGYDRLEQYLENGKFYGAVVAAKCRPDRRCKIHPRRKNLRAVCQRQWQ